MVQWLRLRASTAGGVSSIPDQGTKVPQAVEGTKVPQAVEHGQKKKTKQKRLDFREMHIKTTSRYHNTPTRMDKI